MENFNLGSHRLIVGLLLAFGFSLSPSQGVAQNYIPATRAFDSPACSDSKLAGITTLFGTFPSAARLNPEWKAILDPGASLPNNTPTILEGFVLKPPANEKTKDQAPAEVAEEDTPWNHYTHDYTVHVVPDARYQNLLSSWPRLTQDIVIQFAGTDAEAATACLLVSGTYIGNNICRIAKAEASCPDGSQNTTCHDTDMEVEWDNASLMDEGEGAQRDWGAVPEFVWPAVNDRVWVEGRWIFDCGHPGISTDLQNAADLGLLPNGTTTIDDWVKFSTEIHPPRAMVTFRLNHPGLDSFPRSRNSAPNFPAPQSYLPVTGVPVDSSTLPAGASNSGPTNVPVTEADIFVSSNGGGAYDICNVVPSPCDAYLTLYGAKRSPVIPVNDRNYVFDVYPPGTYYSNLTPNGNFVVHPPVADASLQWRIVDHSGELPLFTCGSADGSGCVTVTPTICLLDDTTPPPNQTETTCPTVPAKPTRARVILPFAGSNANYFAQSVLLGWDDVPAAQNNTPRVRTFQVQLHEFDVESDGENYIFDSADWRVFVSVGGQYRYMSELFDTNANNNTGIYALDRGSNLCHGDRLTHTADGDCFRFDNSPWNISVVDGWPIHVHVGGYQAQSIESSFCRTFPGGCGPNVVLGADLSLLDLVFSHFTRIGTYEFDLMPPDYSPPAAFTTTKLDCPPPNISLGCGLQYKVQFNAVEVQGATPPSSSPLVIGTPNYVGGAGTFFSSATNLTLQSGDSNVEGFQYRFHQQGGPLPTYTSGLSFPVHWTHADFPSGKQSVDVYANGANKPDGPYDFQYSAETYGQLLEPRHTATLILDNTPPVATIVQPTAAQYGHSDMITLGYSVSDGMGSGVKSFTPKVDAQTAAQFCGTTVPNCLDSGQTIYLESMSLGTHTFSVDSVDNVNNMGTNSVTFTITVTFASLAGDVTNLAALGCIDNISQSLIAKFSAAQNLYGKGQIQTAINLLQAAIYEVQAQAGKHISTTCKDPTGRSFNPVNLLTGDIQYLEGILAGQLKADPILGSAVSSGSMPVYGATVNLMSGKTLVATTTTDSFGFYYFADVSGLAVGGTYSIDVVLPKGFRSSSPAAASFTWSQSPVLENFLLN